MRASKSRTLSSDMLARWYRPSDSSAQGRAGKTVPTATSCCGAGYSRRSQQHVVHHRVDGGRSADAQPQCEGCTHCETHATAQSAASRPQVPHQRSHHHPRSSPFNPCPLRRAARLPTSGGAQVAPPPDRARPPPRQRTGQDLAASPAPREVRCPARFQVPRVPFGHVAPDELAFRTWEQQAGKGPFEARQILWRHRPPSKPGRPTLA